MSYRGRPSKGCDSCRARKVKCDELKPICTRCSKAGHECKYRDQAELFFRDQNAFATQRAEGSWRKRSKSHQRATSANKAQQVEPTTDNVFAFQAMQHCTPPGQNEESPNSGVASEASSSALDQNNLGIHLEVQPDIRLLAYERFLYDFVVPETQETDPGGSSNALFDFVPALYERSPEGSCIATIVDAVSYANFSARCNYPQAQIMGEQCLLKGMELLQNLIKDKTLAPSDEALGSVYLLGMYETLVSPKQTGISHAHKDGANALLQLRTVEDYFTNATSARLYEVSYSQMLIYWQQLISSLIMGKAPLYPVRDVAVARQYMLGMYSTSGVYVVHLIYNTATIHAHWQSLRTSIPPPSTRHSLGPLLRSTIDLDADFQVWETTTPQSWKHTSLPNTAETRATFDTKWVNLILSSSGAPDTIHGYCSLRRAWIYMFYRTSRIFLLRCILEIINAMLLLPEPLLPPSQIHTDPMDPQDENRDLHILDNESLGINHEIVTSQLTTLVEKSSAAVIGAFTAPVPGRNDGDVMGMRGYTCLWSLSVMDSVLRAGLIPDIRRTSNTNSNTSSLHFATPSSTSTSRTTSPPNTTKLPAATAASVPPNKPFISPFQGTPIPSPSLFKFAPQHQSKFYYNSATSPADPNDFPKLPPMPMPKPVSQLEAMDIDIDNHAHTTTTTTTVRDDVKRATAIGIDVTARREWIHRVLYYLGAYLGIKKGFVVLDGEGMGDGVRERSRYAVEAMVGRV